MEDGNKPWRVDDSLLLQASKKSEAVQESIDLPAKKDFVKRAKYVIHKTLPNMRPGAMLNKVSASTKGKDGDDKSPEVSGYVVIDQGNRCNILLAEMIRALVKGTTRVLPQMRLMVSCEKITSIRLWFIHDHLHLFSILECSGK